MLFNIVKYFITVKSKKTYDKYMIKYVNKKLKMKDSE